MTTRRLLTGIALCVVIGTGVFTGLAFADDPSLHVSTTQAGPGDKVSFSISNTSAGATYVLRVDDNKVKEGTDQSGNGVADDFTMPDIGGSGRTVSVEAEITQGSTVIKASDFMTWAPAGSGATGGDSSAKQVATTPQSIPSAAPVPRPRTRTAPAHRQTTQPRRGTTTHPQSGTGTAPTTHAAPTPSTRSTTVPSSKARSHKVHAVKPAPVAGLGRPAGPAGGLTANLPPSGGAAATPISGVAQVGNESSAPWGLMVLLGLFLLAGVAAAIVRFGPRPRLDVIRERLVPASLRDARREVDDAARLTALSRAARSGAELQQRLAARRAGR